MGGNSLPVWGLMGKVDDTINITWGVLKRLIAVIVGLYVAFRWGPYVFSALRPALGCVVAAVLLTYALIPWVDWLCRRRLSCMRRRTQRLVATIVVFFVFLGLLGLTIALFVAPVQREADVFVKNFDAYKARMDKLAHNISFWYAESAPDYIKKLIDQIDYSKLTDWITSYAQGAVKVATSSIGYLVELLLIPVLAFYFLWDSKSLTREFYGLIPARRQREAIRIGRGVGEILERYIFGQLILCALAGILTGAFLAIVGMPYVIVLALFAGITRAIPIIGPVVSGIPILLVGLLYSSGWGVPTALMVFITVMHFAESKFIMPQLIGDRLKLHPATVIIVLLIGAQLFGLIGMFLAAPVAAIARELIRAYYIRPRRHRAVRIAEFAEAAEAAEAQPVA